MNCIFPDCSIKRYSRGLCLRHYSLARSLIRTGKTSWQALELNKKALAKSPTKTPSDDAKWFLAPVDQNPAAVIPPTK